MNAEDSIRLTSGAFDREAWTSLWDRLPESAREHTVKFVLQQLHALESNGRWKLSWHYETNLEREESGTPIFAYDQPGDVMTFKGLVQIGYPCESDPDPESIVSVAIVTIADWHFLKQVPAASVDLCEKFGEYAKRVDQRFAELVRAGKNPCRVIVPAEEFLAWCASRGLPPDATSRDVFAVERLQQELALYAEWEKGRTAAERPTGDE